MIQYLLELVAVPARSRPSYSEFDIGEVIHFFFDDTDLGDEGKSNLGEILFDEREQSAVRAVTRVIDGILSEIGSTSSGDFLDHPRWAEVQSCAANALRTIESEGMPKYFSE